jgi:hypothetical protein
MQWTPKQGSWLNIAEIKTRLLVTAYLHSRIGSVKELTNEVTAYLAWKNVESESINWQSNNEKAGSNSNHSV